MQLLGIIGMAIDVGIIIYHRKKLSPQMFVSLMSYSVLAYLSLIAHIIFYGISFSNIAIVISMIFMFLTMQIEQAKNYKSKEAELYDLRIEVMLSQIGHHFIFNTLSTIKYLCGKDPKAAEQTVVEFADYLRGTLDSLSQNRCIPFETELEHVKNYLAIEKKRFGDRVNVEYDIKETDFVIPALSLQPIVENAVKHGICKREDGGTIKISTYSDGDYFKIKVEDDGIGFDPSEEKNDGMNHIGINNVKSRLHTMCEGTLDVTSKKGIGTTAIITIQK